MSHRCNITLIFFTVCLPHNHWGKWMFLQVVRTQLLRQYVIPLNPFLLLNISFGFWLFSSLPASFLTLLFLHMGFTFGLAENFLSVILWYIIWGHSLPVTTSHVNTSWVSQGEAVIICPGELWPFNLTLFTVVIIYNAWKCDQNTNGTMKVSCSLTLNPIGGIWVLLAVNHLFQRCVCVCGEVCVRKNRSWEI